MFRSILAGGVAAAALFQPYAAHAQENAESPVEGASAGQDAAASTSAGESKAATQQSYHSSDSNEIVITGFRRNREDVLSGTSILSGETLARELRTTIGETLARQPGVSATSFGPSASRPILRGFQGDRVRVLTDGIGSLDASNTSVDHAVAINPLTAQRIEVLRGPAALLFGSSAIGGVVNVIDARIPRNVPDEGMHLQGIAAYGSAADERSFNAAADVPVAEHFVLHVDGNYSRSNDLRIGGHVLSRGLREEAAASDDPAVRDLARLRNRLPNTAAESWDVAAGAAYVNGETNIGVSANHYDSLYGIPIRHSLDPDAETEAPRIRIKQDRIDGRAEIDTGSGFIDSIRLRGGYSDYRHDELEQDGAIGTTFLNKAYEARAEAVQSTRGGWGGGFGLQYYHRALDVVGEEKFLPPNDTSQLGLFVLQSYQNGPLRLEAGARYEHTKVGADADADLGNPRLSRRFDAVSASIGGNYAISHDVRIGINASHSERAPSAEELFANGPHAGTEAFEIGDPDLRLEKSWGLEGTLHVHGTGYSLEGSVYRSWFDNYIYDARTGAVEDGLPVFQNFQGKARYWGFEVQGSVDLATIGKFAISADALADYTRATIKDRGPAPRIPPLRLLGGVEAKADRMQLRAEVEWADDQKRVAPLETRTDGYTLVNASLSFQPFGGHASRTSITVSANNIFDANARRHASYLKDFAPLAGRDVRISLHVNL